MADRIEELMTPDYRNKIVRDTLSSLGKLSKETRSHFEGAIRRGGGIRGFQDPFKAPRPLLQSHIVERMNRYPQFKFIVLNVWSETLPALHDAVRARFLDLQDQLDADAHPEIWTEQVEQIAESDDEFTQSDTELMMLYTAHLIAEIGRGILNDGPISEDDDPPVAIVLDRTLSILRETPAGDPEWNDEIPLFAEMLAELIAEKKNSRANSLLDDLKRLHSDFEPELAFFNWQSDEWDADAIAKLDNLAELTRLHDRLELALVAYRPVREQADNLAEERERRYMRHECEETIERLLNAMNELMQAPVTPDDNPPAGVAPDKAAPPASQAEDAPAPPALDSDAAPEAHTAQQPADAAPSADDETVAKLQDEINALKQATATLEDRKRALEQTTAALEDGKRALEQANDALYDANYALKGEVQGLDADKQILAEEAADFKERLRISEAQEIYWRNMYETEMSSKGSPTPGAIPSEIESVKHAIELAKTRHSDSLLIHLNKKSDPDYNYNRPKEIWDALDWLARTYRPTKTGEIRIKDLNESLRNTCGSWEYKPNQTDITVNTNREWYTTTVDGVTYELRKHIGRGISRRDNNIIRIAFDWDEPSQRVVIGFIGAHQRNRSS